MLRMLIVSEKILKSKLTFFGGINFRGPLNFFFFAGINFREFGNKPRKFSSFKVVILKIKVIIFFINLISFVKIFYRVQELV